LGFGLWALGLWGLSFGLWALVMCGALLEQ